MPATRNGGFAGTMPVHAAEGRRDAKPATEIAAEFERRQSCRQSSGPASGTAAWGACAIPGVVRAAKERVTGLPVGRGGREIGSPEQNRSSVHAALRHGGSRDRDHVRTLLS